MHGSRKYGMMATRQLGDAETLCKLSNSKALHDRFRSWVICCNSLIGPAKDRIMQKRSQSVQIYYYPG